VLALDQAKEKKPRRGAELMELLREVGGPQAPASRLTTGFRLYVVSAIDCKILQARRIPRRTNIHGIT